jgi:NitT/TauT family transport system ATP-binding protein
MNNFKLIIINFVWQLVQAKIRSLFNRYIITVLYEIGCLQRYTITIWRKLGEYHNMTKLQAKNIVKHFEHNGKSMLALDNVNLNVEEGDFICIVGPSGCGKSTFLNIVAGLEKPDSGEILLNGKPISVTGPDRTMVFQEGALFPWLKVIDNVEFGLHMAGIPKDERRQISERYLDMMQLTKFADSYTYQLSTGMKQRVAIARALAMDPEILLMDEPFAALDSQTRDLLLVELQLIWERTKKTIIFVTHNISESVVLGSKVEIFKNRPSKIKKEILIDYRRPRLAEDENLQKYYHQILEELKSEVIAQTKGEIE